MKNHLLDELVKGEWLMSLHHLYGYKHYLEKAQAPEIAERKAPEQCISFFNEDMRRIFPGTAQEIPDGTIAVVRMVGGMIKYFNWYWDSAEDTVAQLDFANNLDSIKAIILDIDGPGGSVSAIPLFLDFAKRKKKPVVAIMDNSLSLHRWIPDAVADYQIAANDISARFGSIGVVSSWLDLTAYYEKLGVKEMEAYPEESKHKNEIWKTLKEDEDKGIEMLVERHLRPTAIKFQNAVKAAHPNLIEEEGVLTGRTFSAADALRINMIDSIGTMQDALKMANVIGELGQFKNS